ncbi:hypothetical protein SAMN05216474_0056 [Lishizhenia tianjinensis]|uniref:MORN repeat variant n=1 Tax=Lishizhenia tianjinensis TaxID=477690 RepID=A0A1I6XAM7_9FLAO|nr:hypothetical protein [Lishizhenia tianjinensis]SFT35349.1 hypothetical protein SAMN05216474_0056 [Lishizhenia tianjinensis]
MSKLIGSIFLLVFSLPLLGQFDGSIINTGFIHQTKDKLYLSHHLYEKTNSLLYSNKLNLDSATTNLLQKGNSKWNLPYLEMNYCYLFDRRNTWSIRAYRTLDLKDIENRHFTKGSCSIQNLVLENNTIQSDTIYLKEKSFIHVITQALKEQKITAFSSPHFENNSILYDEIDADKLSSRIYFIKIKEDYHYDKATGRLKAFPIGIALLDKNENEIFWLYYPEIRIELQQSFVTTQFTSQPHISWSEIIEEHHYLSENLQTEPHSNHQAPTRPDYKEHRDDFDALFEIEIIREHITKNYPNYTGEINSVLINGDIVHGELVCGLQQGKWQVLHQNGNQKIELSFKDHLPHGKFLLQNELGKTLIKGSFKNGLRSGIWESYFSNGQKKSRRHYHMGMLEGEQQTWYSSGQKHLHYNYENYQLNGIFERWNTSGILTESGQFKNDHITGEWTIAIKVPEVYQNIIKNNPNYDWGITPTALDDGYLNYSVIIQQYTAHCSKEICSKRISLSAIH